MTRIVRNVEIAGRRTSFRMEQQFWIAADNCAHELGTSINGLFAKIVSEHRDEKATMASAVRTFLICWLRDQALQRERQRGVV